MRIEFGDLIVSEESKRLINKSLNANWVSEGPIVNEFEKSWSELFDYKDSIAVSNGTDADIASCMTLYDFGAKRGDEIIAPALAFVAVGNSILAAGFKPVFVDIERETLNINPSKLEEKITDKTKAIMAVHTMGKSCDMDKIGEIARNYNLRIIEDSCEAHGAKYKDKFVGHFGDLSTFSFYVAHVVACGDGGIVSTNNQELAEIVRSLKTHGRNPGTLYFDHIRHALNFRMNELIACIGIPQLKKFEENFDKRKRNLNYLLEGTKDLSEFAYSNKEESHEVTSPHAFSMTLKDSRLDFDGFYDFLTNNSIKCKRNFGSMPTQHKAFEFLGHKLGEFPESEYVGNNGLHFGVHEYLSHSDLDYCLEVVHDYFKNKI